MQTIEHRITNTAGTAAAAAAVCKSLMLC